MHIEQQTDIIMYYKFSDDFAAPKKCDIQTRAGDKTKPNVCNSMRAIIVQRKKSSFSAKMAENRYQFDSKIAGNMTLYIHESLAHAFGEADPGETEENDGKTGHREYLGIEDIVRRPFHHDCPDNR